jgi:hypothetical protein
MLTLTETMNALRLPAPATAKRERPRIRRHSSLMKAEAGRISAVAVAAR